MPKTVVIWEARWCATVDSYEEYANAVSAPPTEWTEIVCRTVTLQDEIEGQLSLET